VDVVQAGAGFSLSHSRRLASTGAAWILRRLRHQGDLWRRRTAHGVGFGLLSVTHNLHQYFLPRQYLDWGFASCATVPSRLPAGRWMPDGDPAIGQFMTIGGWARAGPPVATHYSRPVRGRVFWWSMAQ